MPQTKKSWNKLTYKRLGKSLFYIKFMQETKQNTWLAFQLCSISFPCTWRNFKQRICFSALQHYFRSSKKPFPKCTIYHQGPAPHSKCFFHVINTWHLEKSLQNLQSAVLTVWDYPLNTLKCQAHKYISLQIDSHLLVLQVYFHFLEMNDYYREKQLWFKLNSKCRRKADQKCLILSLFF